MTLAGIKSRTIVCRLFIIPILRFEKLIELNHDFYSTLLLAALKSSAKESL